MIDSLVTMSHSNRTPQMIETHALPPNPVEELKSTTKSSRGPIALAIDIMTTGAFITAGAVIAMFCGSLELQLEQKRSDFDVHWAFNTPLFSTHTLFTRKEEGEKAH